MLQLQQIKSLSNRYLRYAAIFSLLGLIILLPSLVFAASVTKTNGTDGAADGNIGNELTRTVEFTTTDFLPGASISSVTATVQFAKIDAPNAASCFTVGHQGGSPFNREIYMYLTSPNGTRVSFIEDSLNSGGSSSAAPHYTYTTNNGYNGTVTITFDDGGATQVGGPAPISGTFRPEQPLSAYLGEDPAGTWTLTVGDNLNSAPICFYDFSLTVNAEQAPVMDDQTFSIAENSANDSVVDTIEANDADPGDKLSFVVTGGTGQAVFDVDSLTGEITVADETQLTSIGSFTLNVRVTDSAALSDTAVITINVTNQNDAPVITEGTSTTVNMDEDSTPTPFSLTLNATDEEGDDLTWTISSQGSNGTASTTAGVGISNDIDYIPNLNFNGSDSFIVQVSDGNSGTDTITVNVNVAAQADAPIAKNDGYTVDEDSSGNILSVMDNDSDPDAGATLTITAVDNPTTQNGTATISGSNISYTPRAGFVGTDSFTYTIEDNTTLTDTATVTITVRNVNEAPVITEGLTYDAGSMDEDGTPTAFTPFILNATDGDGDNLSWSIQSQGMFGTAVITGTNPLNAMGFSYTPNANMYGNDSFVVRVSDGNGGIDDITVSVLVNEINDNPDAVDDAPSVNEQSSNNLLSPLSNDTISPDTGEILTISHVGTPDNGGTVMISGSNLSYTPASTFIGTETFTYTISDGRSGSDTATIRVSVDDVNYDPIITEGASVNVTMDEDGSPTPFNLTLNATDADADTINWSIITQGSNGYATATGTGNSKAISYAPSGDYNGTDSFVVRITDGRGGTDSILVNVTINPVNDAPTALDDENATPADTAVTINVLDNDTDPEDDSLSITSVTQGSKGSVTHNGTTATYTPNFDAVGEDTFTYTISDGNGGTDTATVTVRLGLYELFVPLINNQFVSAPDLVVTNINASSNYIAVTIENQGTLATTSGFWVDFYIAPITAPTHENELWSDLGDEGLVWGVDISIAPGGSLTLVYSAAPGAPNLFYSATNSNYDGTLLTGTSVYAQVDSAHLTTTYGGVLETHEITGEPYNNVSAEYFATTGAPSVENSSNSIMLGQPLALPLR